MAWMISKTPRQRFSNCSYQKLTTKMSVRYHACGPELVKLSDHGPSGAVNVLWILLVVFCALTSEKKHGLPAPWRGRSNIWTLLLPCGGPPSSFASYLSPSRWMFWTLIVVGDSVRFAHVSLQYIPIMTYDRMHNATTYHEAILSLHQISDIILISSFSYGSLYLMSYAQKTPRYKMEYFRFPSLVLNCPYGSACILPTPCHCCFYPDAFNHPTVNSLLRTSISTLSC